MTVPRAQRLEITIREITCLQRRHHPGRRGGQPQEGRESREAALGPGHGVRGWNVAGCEPPEGVHRLHKGLQIFRVCG